MGSSGGVKMAHSKALIRSNFSSASEQKFWSLVEIKSEDECWPWKGLRFSRGYGRFCVNGRVESSNRTALVLSGVDIPERMMACHSCDNPPCCNPKHLWLGTGAENAADCKRKGRTGKTGDNHPLRRHPELRKFGDKHHFRINPELIPKGEQCGSHKLKENEVIKIRNLISTGANSYNSIAAMFNVTPSNIRAIVVRKTWKHLP